MDGRVDQGVSIRCQHRDADLFAALGAFGNQVRAVSYTHLEYLPLLSCVLMADGILTKPLKAVIRKGKSHYVCDERLDRRLRQVYPAKKNPEALTALRTLRETLEDVYKRQVPGCSRSDTYGKCGG